MVHALELVHSLLNPHGLLVDIHPTGQPPLIEITSAGQTHQLGELQEADDFIEYHQADEALEQVIQSGLFLRARQETFTFLTHASSLDELRIYLQKNWSDVIWPDEVSRRANILLSSAHPAELPATVCESTSIHQFLRLDSL